MLQRLGFPDVGPHRRFVSALADRRARQRGLDAAVDALLPAPDRADPGPARAGDDRSPTWRSPRPSRTSARWSTGSAPKSVMQTGNVDPGGRRSRPTRSPTRCSPSVLAIVVSTVGRTDVLGRPTGRWSPRSPCRGSGSSGSASSRRCATPVRRRRPARRPRPLDRHRRGVRRGRDRQRRVVRRRLPAHARRHRRRPAGRSSRGPPAAGDWCCATAATAGWSLAIFGYALTEMTLNVAMPVYFAELLGLPGWVPGAVFVINTVMIGLGQGLVVRSMTGAIRVRRGAARDRVHRVVVRDVRTPRTR